MNIRLVHRILSGLLWIICCALVIFSWVYFGKNGVVHGLFLLIFLMFFGVNAILHRLNPKTHWQRIIIVLSKITFTLLALVILSGEYHRLFHENLPLFD